MAARKARISDLVSGTMESGRLHTTLGDIFEARLVGTIVDAFLSSDGNYAALTLDDGTETIRLKQWAEGVASLSSFKKGDIVEVLGRPLSYNDEIYISPDLIVCVSPNRWAAHELEILELLLHNTPSRKEKEEPEGGREEAASFDIFEEDDYVEAVFEALKDRTLTKKEIIASSHLDDIDVELALRQLLDDGRVELSGGKYKRTI